MKHFRKILSAILVSALAWLGCVREVQPCDARTDAFSARAALLAGALRLPDERLKDIPLLVQDLELTLSARWPGVRVLVFGSTVSGLALQNSDVDCFVLSPNNSLAGAPAASAQQALAVLESHPELFADFRDNHGAFPHISFKHIPSGFHVDLNFKTIEGIQNTELVRYFIHSDECVYHLAVIVKYWAKLHNVNKHKMLPSYGVVLLLIFYLQQKHILPPVDLLQKNAKAYFVENWNMGFDRIVYKPRNIEPLYQLMGGFFEYYNSFNFEENIVSSYVARPVKRHLFQDLRNVPDEFSLYRQNVCLNIKKPLDVSSSACIQDPFYHNKNVGKKVDTSPGSQFREAFRLAAIHYREHDESVFLDQILH